MMTKTNRTQINDLPEHAVELTDMDMRIVNGGLATPMGCYSAKVQTNTSDKGDHDTDWTTPDIFGNDSSTSFSSLTFSARLA